MIEVVCKVIKCDFCVGSGVLISPKHVLTCAHVVSNDLTIQLSDGTSHQGKLKAQLGTPPIVINENLCSEVLAIIEIEKGVGRQAFPKISSEMPNTGAVAELRAFRSDGRSFSSQYEAIAMGERCILWAGPQTMDGLSGGGYFLDDELLAIHVGWGYDQGQGRTASLAVSSAVDWIRNKIR